MSPVGIFCFGLSERPIARNRSRLVLGLSCSHSSQRGRMGLDVVRAPPMGASEGRSNPHMRNALGNAVAKRVAACADGKNSRSRERVGMRAPFQFRPVGQKLATLPASSRKCVLKAVLLAGSAQGYRLRWRSKSVVVDGDGAVHRPDHGGSVGDVERTGGVRRHHINLRARGTPDAEG